MAHWNDQINFDLQPMLSLGKARYLANGHFLCDITAEGMHRHVVDASRNLIDWVPLATNAIGSAVFEDARRLGFPRRFYRARPGP